MSPAYISVVNKNARIQLTFWDPGPYEYEAGIYDTIGQCLCVQFGNLQ